MSFWFFIFLQWLYQYTKRTIHIGRIHLILSFFECNSPLKNLVYISPGFLSRSWNALPNWLKTRSDELRCNLFNIQRTYSCKNVFAKNLCRLFFTFDVLLPIPIPRPICNPFHCDFFKRTNIEYLFLYLHFTLLLLFFCLAYFNRVLSGLFEFSLLRCANSCFFKRTVRVNANA